MSIKRILHLAIGPLSIIPLCYVLVLIINMFSYPDLLIQIEDMFFWLFWVVLLLIGIISYYVVYIFHTAKIPSNKKTLWTILLFFGHVVILPIFWYVFLTNDSHSENVSK